MSAIHQYTVDALGFVPRLWQIWRDPVLGAVRCIGIVKDFSAMRYFVTVEILPYGWNI